MNTDEHRYRNLRGLANETAGAGDCANRLKPRIARMDANDFEQRIARIFTNLGLSCDVPAEIFRSLDTVIRSALADMSGKNSSY